MAWENQLLNIGQFNSSGDMTGNQYKAVQLSTTDADNSVILVGAKGGKVDGVWQDNSTQATAGAMMVYGVSKLDALSSAAAITVGDRLVADVGGSAVLSTAAGQHLIGISYGQLGANSTGIVPVLLTLGAIST